MRGNHHISNSLTNNLRSNFPVANARLVKWSSPLATQRIVVGIARPVVLFFSSKGKFTRMFSNVAVIPPIFPSTEATWQRLMWGEPVNQK
jgi:hypothetical protein